jgi:hypothetical protein
MIKPIATETVDGVTFELFASIIPDRWIVRVTQTVDGRPVVIETEPITRAKMDEMIDLVRAKTAARQEALE